MQHQIQTWSSIKDRYKGALILGNGASIAVSKMFSYKSLFEAAKSTDKIQPEAISLFEKFKTSDFERILMALAIAYDVNSTLQVSNKEIINAYGSIKQMLIETIHKCHVSYQLASDRFEKIGKYLKHFKTIYSLNYDLVVYWAILYSNEKWGKKWFKDGFINGEFRDDWKYLRDGYEGANGATIVFYPHGNLVLKRNIYGVERKIIANEDYSLVDSISKEWGIDQFYPMFISEGTTEEKLQAIHRNAYTYNVLTNGLMKIEDSVAVYGWGVGQQDRHILTAISNNRPQNIAISVFDGLDDEKEYCDRVIAEITSIPNLKRVNVEFYSSKSDECWCY